MISPKDMANAIVAAIIADIPTRTMNSMPHSVFTDWHVAITQALQDERNAALEDAAKVADGIAHYEDDPQGYALQVARAIRKLKGDAS